MTKMGKAAVLDKPDGIFEIKEYAVPIQPPARSW